MSSSNGSMNYQIFPEYPDVVTVSQLSVMLKTSTKTVYKLLHDNEIEHFKVGRTFKIPKINVLKYMAVNP